MGRSFDCFCFEKGEAGQSQGGSDNAAGPPQASAGQGRLEWDTALTFPPAPYRYTISLIDRQYGFIEKQQAPRKAPACVLDFGEARQST
jgi:hypothetical protein